MPRSEDFALSARQALDDILTRKPEKSSHEFSKATQCLCALRDHWIAECGGAAASPAARSRLDQVNAVISVLIAGHFPLGKIPWAEIERSRAIIAEME